LTTENNTNIGNKSILEKEKHSVYQDAIEEVIEYKNPYAFKRKPSVSKSRLKKCEKGLHEYMSEGKIKIDEHFIKKMVLDIVVL
jgi:hypothetical protein